MKPVIYISHPFANRPFGEIVDESNYISKTIRESNFDCHILEPFRESLENSKYDEDYIYKHNNGEGCLNSPSYFANKDKEDVLNSDGVLLYVNTPVDLISHGCIFEVGWASAANIPVFVCMQESNKMWSPIMKEMVVTRSEDLSEVLLAMKHWYKRFEFIERC